MANMKSVKKTTMIDSTPDLNAPVAGAEKVFMKINGVWVHKGWVMPPVVPYGIGYRFSK